MPWDGKGLPEVITNSSLVTGDSSHYRSHFGAWGRKLFEHRKAGMPELQSTNSAVTTKMWPYIITRRCQGKMLAQIRESMSRKDSQSLASFLGEHLSHLHRLPLPPFETALLTDLKPNMGWLTAPNTLVPVPNSSCFATECVAFISTLVIKKENVIDRLTKWEVPITKNLMAKIKEYLPDDLEEFHLLCEGKTCTWVHSDIMDDNVYMEPSTDSASDGSCTDGRVGEGVVKSWKPSYILDFSDLTIGDPLLDLIPIHLDVFRGDVSLLKQLLLSYKLPFTKKEPEQMQATDSKFQRLSYHAMCYCILHDEDVLSAIFSIWEGLRSANSWEEVEEKVWGELNNYNGFS
ncbi:Lysine-specific demethylase JMJ21-like protein [Drosera capensis]